MKMYSIIIPYLLTYLVTITSCIPRNQSQETDKCGLNGYEAHCVLDIMEEHIEATAIVNHCHVPLDITFRVVYRYGNGTEQRWQYTFVTTNQNERVLIPGLLLPSSPHALVYLFVRVPQGLFDLHNTSLAAVEVSFVAVLSEEEWEEVEFLNEAVTVLTTEDCFAHTRDRDPLTWIIGGALIGILCVGGLTTGVLWWYRKKKIAMDELALMSSLETGLPGARPYQVGVDDQKGNNNNISDGKDESKNSVENRSQKAKEDANETPSDNNKISAFKFERLQEDSSDELKERIAKNLGRAVVIGNPVLVDKTSLLQPGFNRMTQSKPCVETKVSKVSTKVVESVGDAYRNPSTEDSKGTGQSAQPETQESKIDGHDKTVSKEEIERRRKNETRTWKAHPLELSPDEPLQNGARPKSKLPNTTNGHHEK